MNIEDKELEQFRRSQRRKDIIKNITIVFLLILLALTFFSRTIMNLTLPQVATHIVSEGEVSPRIRGQGTAEVDDPFSVTVAQARMIKSVAVRQDQKVKRGDVLYYLEDSESEELRNARQELDDQKANFTKRLFDGTLSDSDITRMRAGNYRSDDELQSELASINRRYERANREKAAADAAYEKLLAEEDDSEPSSSTPIEDEVPDDDVAVAAKKTNTGIEAPEDASEGFTDDDPTRRKKSKYQKKLEKANIRKIDADLALAEITAEKEKVINSISAELELKGIQDAITKAEAKVERLEKEEIGATITAPVDGTVTSLSYGAGETTSADSPVAIIRLAGKSLTVSFSVTKEQAQKLKVGDEAKPQNPWEYEDDFKAVLRQIAADSSDPKNQRLLKFEITSSSVTAGDSVQLQLAESTKSYDLVVPNSAVRTDANGKFVLVLQTRQSPLGNRYVAMREDVKVLAKDDSNTAISGAIGAYTFVITTSNKSVKSGDQVRLADEEERTED